MKENAYTMSDVPMTLRSRGMNNKLVKISKKIYLNSIKGHLKLPMPWGVHCPWPGSAAAAFSGHQTIIKLPRGSKTSSLTGMSGFLDFIKYLGLWTKKSMTGICSCCFHRPPDSPICTSSEYCFNASRWKYKNKYFISCQRPVKELNLAVTIKTA